MCKCTFFSVFFVLLTNILLNVYLQTVELSIRDGDILGQVNTTVRNNMTYYSFRGIPYAQPPTGDLRFRSPIQNDPWNGTLDATNDKSECLQLDSLIAGSVKGGEDCLYINAYTPRYKDSSLPVVVWIYGGVFCQGNGSYVSYGPDYFLEQDVVFVSFNYRLGILGFMSTEDEACPGNWGIKDQILALEWVQENIENFGGNPNNVTIFGTSAGAVSVHLLLQTNLTNGLFHRAVMDSGTTLNLWSLNTRASSTAFLVGTALGVVTTNSTLLVEKLREIDADSLLSVGWSVAETLFLSDGLRGLPYAPVMEPDIEGAVFVRASETALSQGNFQQVPLLMGFNSQEAVYAGDLAYLLTLYLTYYDVAVSYLTPWSFTQNSNYRFLAGSDIKYNYFKLSGLATNTQQLINFLSADQFNRPIRKAATDMSNYTTVYFYQFGYQGYIGNDGEERTYEGTGHAEDVYYLFRVRDNYTEADLKVSETMVILWSNFIKYGNPTPWKDEALNNTIWEPIDALSNDFAYLCLNESISNAVNPKQSDWEYYESVWERYGTEDTLTTY